MVECIGPLSSILQSIYYINPTIFNIIHWVAGSMGPRNYEKNNTWNIRRLVDESFVPANQRIILKIVGFYVKFSGCKIRFYDATKKFYKPAD